MSKPLVTIAIPTYNRAGKYLRPTLESATRQSYQNIEILVSDNCSTDNTSEVVASFEDARIKYFRQEVNLGAYANWNFLLKEAKGDYFHMYHDDDRIDEDFIESCITCAEHQTDKGLIMTGSRVIDENGGIIRQNLNSAQGGNLEDFILSWYRGEINVFFCSSLFNTTILRESGGFQPTYNHYIDVAAQFKCAAAGRIDISDIKASFRHHEGSITTQSNAHVDNWIKNARDLLDLAISLAPQKKALIKKEGMKTSAMNVYMYANEIESKAERSKAFLQIYKAFGFRHLPPLKYANQLIPFMGYVLHPYRALSLFKWKILNRLSYNTK